MSTAAKPNMLWSMFTFRCPRCRKGEMFHHPNPWKLNKVLSMPEKCKVCGQPFELEPGFYYGTGYVSYGLSVAYLIFTFVLWKLLIGMSIDDNRFFWWMGLSIASLIILQPWLMRLSRVMYLYFFVKYDPDYKTNPVVKFD
jgi:hypothetical protein